MKYISTRDATRTYTFEEALFLGYAPDGGLFVPEQLPDLGNNNNRSAILSEEWPKLGYLDLATEVLHPFLGDETIPKETLRGLLRDALSGFDTPDENLVPVVPLKLEPAGTDDDDDDDDDGTTIITTTTTTTRCRCYVAELFHGPTFCFKDLGMRATIYLLEYFACHRTATNINHKHNPNPTHEAAAAAVVSPTRVVLTAATTGDTGPAAVRAVRDRNSPNLGIVVHYPDGQISEFQRKQMTCSKSESESDRVKIVAFAGGGDDMDRPIKRILSSSHQSSKPNVLVCGVNSYNIGRPLMQMVHFVWTYLRVVERIEIETGKPVDHETFRLDVVVPTGAMGNLAGCYMAKKLGIPFGRLCAGVNANDFTHRAVRTGTVARPKPGDSMVATLSEAINIQLPYNLERLLFYATDGNGENHALLRSWYEQLEGERGCFDLPPEWLRALQSEFASARVTDDELCATMRRVDNDNDPASRRRKWIDPHTGVAVAAACQLGYFDGDSSSSSNTEASRAGAVAIMATASPCKFQSAVTTALGRDRWDEYERDHFPSRGSELKDRTEVPPIVYAAEPGKTLEENQVVWEAKTRALIEQLGR
eukprot:jgi/Psemu1/213538/e_gw1.647.25.1